MNQSLQEVDARQEADAVSEQGRGRRRWKKRERKKEVARGWGERGGARKRGRKSASVKGSKRKIENYMLT